MVVASAVPGSYTGLASGLAAAAMQVGGAIGTAGFIVVGVSVAAPADGTLDASGFSAAFAAAGLVALRRPRWDRRFHDREREPQSPLRVYDTTATA